MAIVILIAGIMMGAGLSLLAVKQAAAQADATQKHQETIKQALINYLGKNKRLPCPATFANGGAPATPPPCASYTGIVPYFELGLDRAAVLDGWENYITYVVSPPGVAPLSQPPTLTTAWLYAYSSSNNTPPNTIIGSSAFWPNTSTGGIQIAQTIAPLQLIADPTQATGAAVALISYGKNGFGATNIKGNTNANALLPAINTDEVQNFNPFTAPTQPIVVKRDITDSTAAVGGPFDDIVMILSAQDLTGPLIANGTLQSSAQAALSQANDAVLGNIIASRQYIQKSCLSPLPLPAPQPASFSTCFTLGSFDTANYYNIAFYSLPYSCSTPPATPIPPTNCAGFYTNSSMSGAWTAVALASGITYTVATKFSCPYSPPLPSPGCAAGEYYYAIDSAVTQTPPVIYGTPAVNMNGVAYQLTAGDGTTKTVTIQELRGILTRGAGFN